MKQQPLPLTGIHLEDECLCEGSDLLGGEVEVLTGLDWAGAAHDGLQQLIAASGKPVPWGLVGIGMGRVMGLCLECDGVGCGLFCLDRDGAAHNGF